MTETIEMMHQDEPQMTAFLTYLDDAYCGKDDHLIAALHLANRSANGYQIDGPGTGSTSILEGKLGIVFCGQSALLFIPNEGHPILEYLPELSIFERWQETGWRFRK